MNDSCLPPLFQKKNPCKPVFPPKVSMKLWIFKRLPCPCRSASNQHTNTSAGNGSRAESPAIDHLSLQDRTLSTKVHYQKAMKTTVNIIKRRKKHRKKWLSSHKTPAFYEVLQSCSQGAKAAQRSLRGGAERLRGERASRMKRARDFCGSKITGFCLFFIVSKKETV